MCSAQTLFAWHLGLDVSYHLEPAEVRQMVYVSPLGFFYNLQGQKDMSRVLMNLVLI